MLAVRVHQDSMTTMVLDTAMAMPTYLRGTRARLGWIEGYLHAVYGVGHHETTAHVVDGCDQLAGLLINGNRRDRTIDNVTTKQVAHTFGIFGPARAVDWSPDE